MFARMYGVSFASIGVYPIIPPSLSWYNSCTKMKNKIHEKRHKTKTNNTTITQTRHQTQPYRAILQSHIHT